MIELKAILRKLLCLSGLNLQPTSPEGWTQLARVLQRRCLTMDHIERVLDRWLETEQNVPKPSELAALCAEVPADPALDHPILAEPCAECAGDGLWRTVERLDRYGQIVYCLARCTCARGRQLAAIDAARMPSGPERAREPLRLAAASENPRLSTAIETLVEAKSLPPENKPLPPPIRLKRDRPVPPPLDPGKAITEADVRQAVEDLRKRT